MTPKRSIILCAFLILITAATGWWQQKGIAQRVAIHRQLTEKALKLGLKVPDADRNLVAAVTKRQREDEELEARAVAREIIAVSAMNVMDDPEAKRRSSEVAERLEKLSGKQLMIVLEEVRNASFTDEKMRSGYQNYILGRLVEKDPRAALQLFEAMENKDETLKYMIQGAVGKLAESDPEAAYQWLVSHKSNDERYDSLIRTTLQGATKKDVRAAFSMWEKLRANSKQGLRSSELLQMCKSPSEVMEMFGLIQTFASTLPDTKNGSRERANAVSTLASVFCNKDGAEMRDLLARAQLSDLDKKGFADNLANYTQLKDAPGWIKWTETNLPVEQSTKTISRMVESWTKKDYPAVTQWLNELPASPTKEVAVRRFAETVAGYDPQGAEQWAETLADEKARTDTYKTIFKRWPKDDPDGKAAFKTKHGL